MPIESAKNPVQFWNSNRYARARAEGVLGRRSGKVRLTKAAIQSEPGRRLDLILNIGRKNTPGGFFDVRRAEVGRALVVIDQAERLAILLREAVDTCAQIVALPDPGQRKLASFIIG